MRKTISHGGNIYAAARMLAVDVKQILDLSASINPLGMPQSVRSAIIRHIRFAEHYPDPDCLDLTHAIAHHYKIDPETIVCGNGSTELIHLIVRALRPEMALIPAPTFAEYERAIVTHSKGCALTASKIHFFQLTKQHNFQLNADAYISAMHAMATRRSNKRNNPRTNAIAFICNPNNPTGLLLSRSDVLKIAKAAEEIKCYLVVDEAFIDFCPGASIIGFAVNHPHLIIVRSMTKFYALAGIRLGFGVFPLPIARRLQMIREPWAVSTIAQIAGYAALQDHGFITKTHRLISREKHFLESSFRSRDITYLPSAANYYLLNILNAEMIIQSLAQKGILVRSCGSFRGLSNSYIRIAVRSHAENTRFLEELPLCKHL
jgi:threonine-phosphate decarboxylase